MSTELATGIILPEEDGDSQIWDNKINQSLTLIDTLLRQQVALMNEQEPLGTVKQIPSGASLPVGWEEIANSQSRVLVSVEDGVISDGQLGGEVAWGDVPGYPLTFQAGDHQHGPAGGHQHSAAGNHQHAATGGHNHFGVDFGADSGLAYLTQAQLPNVVLQVVNGDQVVTLENTGSFIGNYSGDATNFYLKNITQTSPLGSGAGHSHTIEHQHIWDGNHAHDFAGNHQHGAVTDHQHAAVGTHAHEQQVHRWLCGGRWIRKARLLTLADLLSMAPVS